MVLDIIDSNDMMRIHIAKRVPKDIKCCKCGRTETSQWCRNYNKDGNWDRKSYICNICWQRTYRKDHPEKDIRKLMSQHKEGKLSRYSPVGKGFIGTQIVCNALGIDDCNIKTDNFNFWIDAVHEKY